MLVLEDLQWADDGTIRMLQFLARDTRPRRLAIVGTYRDTDLDPAHPLAVGLAELVRDGLHVSLGGLGPRDVATLVNSVEASSPDTPGAVARLHRQSGGNPFFLWELLQLERSDGVRTAPPASAPRCPAAWAGCPTRPGTPWPRHPYSARTSTSRSSVR